MRREAVLHAARTSTRRIALALAGTLIACAGAAGEALAAPSFAVTVSPATPGAATALQPVKVALRASLGGSSTTTPPPVRMLSIALPDGFTTTLAATVSCVAPDFSSAGSAACPAGSRLGAGSASFVYVAGAARIAASTDELVLFHGERQGSRSGLYLFMRISKPVALSFVVPGTVEDRPPPAGPLVSFDLSRVAQPEGGGRVSVTKAAFDLDRGLVGGPCPAGSWTFTARLEYVGGAVDEPRADAACSSVPDTKAPSLRVSARDGRAASGARFAIRLSEPASLRIALERRARGRWVAVERATVPARAGRSVVRIRRIGGRAPAPGRYRARLRAYDASGLASPKRTVTFRLR